MRKIFWMLCILLFFLWIVDSITTYIGIRNGYGEVNPVFAWGFGISVFWTFFFDAALIVGLFLLLCYLFRIITNRFYAWRNITFFMLIPPLLWGVVTRILTIISNIKVIS